MKSPNSPESHFHSSDSTKHCSDLHKHDSSEKSVDVKSEINPKTLETHQDKCPLSQLSSLGQQEDGKAQRSEKALIDATPNKENELKCTCPKKPDVVGTFIFKCILSLIYVFGYYREGYSLYLLVAVILWKF
ncbi:hypothetical protein BGX26_005404 [Mortierella sp. AD094]|nr:hypothetical protein BGX26_005404 [Mortierella sp. AD094]